MKKIKNLIVFSLIGINTSCTSTSQKVNKKNIEIRFEKIKLNDSESIVIELTGSPSEVRRLGAEDVWIYNNSDDDGFQRAAISFEPKTKLVNGVTLIPGSDDLDSKLEYVQNQKIPASDYVATPLQRCRRDYFPNNIFYISPSKGFIIDFDSVHHHVNSYSWTSTQHAAALIKRIKNCER